ncbi:MAG: alcohol dehydrogenase catalytic domain-containing protein [Chloroflexota bacterium]
MNSRNSMKVAVYYNNKKIDLEERQIPEIASNEILVQTKACGLCGGETMEWYLAPRAPKILGHEPTGIVAKCGADVKGVKEGDRVFVHHHVPCFKCHYCINGFYTLCETYKKTNIDPGGFAEYFRVPAPNLEYGTLILPEHISFDEGTLIEPMACTLRGVKQTKVNHGDTVVIIGLGMMGMSYLKLLALTPAAAIIALDFSDWRLEKAIEFGATHTINPKREPAKEKLQEINHGRLADAVFVTAPSVPAWEAGFGLCGKGSRIHFGAPPHPDDRLNFNPNWAYFNELNVNCSYSASHIETREMLQLISSGRVDVKPLITHHFGLHQVPEAVSLLLGADRSFKSVIVPEMTTI